MGLLLLWGFSVLLSWPVLAEVAPNFDRCKQFFYKSQEPTWFQGQNLKNICQKHNSKYYFATLYDTGSRIAHYSGYTPFKGTCPNQPQRRSQWFIEPQLTIVTATGDMKTENQAGLHQGRLKQNQAISIDYEDTTYDRGQLNPYSFQCNTALQPGRDATFTLTNAVPIDPGFNRVRWSKLEKTLRDQLSISCPGTAYLLTGSVPNPAKKIPDFVYDSEGDRIRAYKRVVIPSHIWTAVCCDNSNENLKFSLGFLAENKEGSLLRSLPVEQLEGFLRNSSSFPATQPFKLFADYCNPDSEKGREVLDKINNALIQDFQDMMGNFYPPLIPNEERDRLDKGAKALMTSMDVDQQSLRLTGIMFEWGFPNLSEWYRHAVTLSSQDDMACVLSSIRGASSLPRAAMSSKPVVCLLQQQKHMAPSSVSAKGWRCVLQNCDNHGGTSYSWCSTSYSNGWDYCCTGKCTFDSLKAGHFCRSRDKTVACSPLYSAVAVNGEPCRPDHPCGLYEKSYYWCYTDHKDNWQYCCGPWHYCEKHGKSYNWCYIDDIHSSNSVCII